jgi:hypothetical protein
MVFKLMPPGMKKPAVSGLLVSQVGHHVYLTLVSNVRRIPG